jgi:hypothetical protein
MPTSGSTRNIVLSRFDDIIDQLIEDNDAPDVFVPFNYSSNAAEARCIATTGASYLLGFTVSNANVAARFVQLFDLDKFPANGAVPNLSVSVATVSDKEMLWYPPRAMNRGIVLCSSTTQNTLTLAGADHLFDVQYV